MLLPPELFCYDVGLPCGATDGHWEGKGEPPLVLCSAVSGTRKQKENQFEVPGAAASLCGQLVPGRELVSSVQFSCFHERRWVGL